MFSPIAPMGPPVLYIDFNSPYAYLAFERAESVLGVKPEIEVIALASLHRHYGRVPWSMRDDTKGPGMADCERRASEYGLPPIKWPPNWPVGSYSLLPLRAAHAAARKGELDAFCRAAFRRHFQEGLPLTRPEDIGPGLDPESPEAKASLKDATERAIQRGVLGVPTTEVGGRLFWGDDLLPEAKAAKW